MQKLHVNLVGLGGIGCCLAPILARWLNFSYPGSTIVLIDDDVFEARNAPRQSVIIGSNKAIAIQRQLMSSGFRDLAIHARDERLDDSNVEDHIGTKQITMLCVDNHPTRKLVSEFVASERPDAIVISGSNGLENGFVQVFVRRAGKNLTLPLANKLHPEISEADPLEAGAVGCDRQVENVEQLLITNNAVASQMLMALYGVLNLPEHVLYDEAMLDIRSGNSLSYDRSSHRR